MRSSVETRRKRKDATFLKALNRVLMVLVFLGFLAIVAFWFYPEVTYRNKLVAQLEDKKAHLAALQLTQKQREREVYLLQNDPEYIEIIARDKLDLMRPGETIYRFDSARAASKR